MEEATRRHDEAEHTAMAVDAVQQAMQGLDAAEQHSNATRAAAGQVGPQALGWRLIQVTVTVLSTAACRLRG